MMSQSFEFKHFSVRQDRCAMKVGTDGVLLGAWAEGGRRILDAGAGTGLIAMMMAQRMPDAKVDAVEIEHEAALQAAENVTLSPYYNRVTVTESSLQDYAGEFKGERYDAIVSNPPYFSSSLKNPDNRRALARHTDSLSFRDLFKAVDTLLSRDGVFSAVLPTDVKNEFMTEAAIFGFFLSRETLVRTTPRKQPKRCLLAFRRQRPEILVREEVSMMDAGNVRSAWYEELTADFYLSKG